MRELERVDRKLLHYLSDGEFHSGAKLAADLRISRAAVWKKVRGLEVLGLQFERQHGKGYRLLQPVELYDLADIQNSLSATVSSDIEQLVLHDFVTSTNDVCLAGLRDGTLGHATVVLAEQQTNGRGRRGKAWISPFAKNIYLSLIWEYGAGVAVIEGLSLAIGIGLFRALRTVGIEDARLKWPNDLQIHSKKIGGVLIDVVGDLNGPVTTVIGVGINTDMSANDGAEIDQPWSTLREVAALRISRNRVVAELLNECIRILRQFPETGFAVYATEWNELDATNGCQVSVSAGEYKLTGTARGVDETGALMLGTNDGIRAIRGGELSLRVGD